MHAECQPFNAFELLRLCVTAVHKRIRRAFQQRAKSLCARRFFRHVWRTGVSGDIAGCC
jgi:hypothetical protein